MSQVGLTVSLHQPILPPLVLGLPSLFILETWVLILDQIVAVHTGINHCRVGLHMLVCNMKRVHLQ